MDIRPRRNRKSDAIRSLVRENTLQPSDFIMPLFLIEGEKKKASEEKEKNFYREERCFGKFKRSFTLPVEVVSS